MKTTEQEKFWIWLLISMSCLFFKLARTLPMIDLEWDETALISILVIIIFVIIIQKKYSNIIDNFIIITYNMIIFLSIPSVNWIGKNHLATIIADFSIAVIILGGFLRFFFGKDFIISATKEWKNYKIIFKKFPDKR
jgi:hypothetical protein